MSEFVTPIPESEQWFRPRHQHVWPIWETRDTLENLPHVIGFPKHFANQESFILVKNGATKLEPAETVEAAVTIIEEITLTEIVGKTDTQLPITVGTTTVTEDQFADGNLQIKDHTGKGHQIAIAGNDAGGGTAADTVNVYLAHRLPVDLDLTTDVQIVTSWLKNVIKATGPTKIVLGIPRIEVPPNYYFWLQYSGPALAIAGAAITAPTDGHVALTAGTTDGTLISRASTAGMRQIVALLNETSNVVSGELMNVLLKC